MASCFTFICIPITKILSANAIDATKLMEEDQGGKKKTYVKEIKYIISCAKYSWAKRFTLGSFTFQNAEWYTH